MSQQRYVAAIEISSSKIIGAVGIPSSDGSLRVVAIEKERSQQENVRRGMIHNIEGTRLQTERVIEMLEKRTEISPRKIKRLFVGLSARSMKSIPASVSLTLPGSGDEMVSDDTIEALKRQALNTPIAGSLEIVDVVPRRFIIDDNPTYNPVGTIGHKIDATFDLIVVRPEIKRNILRTFDKMTSVDPAGFIVTPMAVAHLILSEEERRLGCMLVDMGAETTTVSIYKEGALSYFCTLPLGSRNITLDITSLRTSEENAERIKLTSGDAKNPDQPNPINISGLKMSDVSDVIVARSNEIVANIIMQIDYAGLKPDDLVEGIILVGGGSGLRNITEVLASQSRLKVRRGSLPSYITITESKVTAAEYIPIVSVLYSAAMFTDAECLELPRTQNLPVNGELPVEEPEPRKPDDNVQPSGMSKRMTSWKERIARIFNPQEDEGDTDIE